MDHGTTEPMHFRRPEISAPSRAPNSALLMQVNDTEELLSALSGPEAETSSHLFFLAHAAAVRPWGDDITACSRIRACKRTRL